MAAAPHICPTLVYDDAQAAIELLTEGFGLTVTAVYESEDGRVAHAELSYGNGVVMLSSRGTGTEFDRLMAGAGPAGLFVHVDDVDGHHARAVSHGAEVVVPPTDQEYGARDYVARDAGGNVWTFGTYVPGAAE